jgi:hypothetical protein
MTLPSVCKSIFIVIATHLIIACSENSDNETDKSEIAQSDTPSCQTADLSSLSMLLSTTPDFGDGSDGELYLAAGEVFVLEARSYNFSNIYTEADSVLTASDETIESGGIIQINAVGNCELYGKIALAGYKGSVELNCYGQIDLSGDIDISGSSMTISTSDESISLESTGSGAEIYSINIGSGSTIVPDTADSTAGSITDSAFNTDDLSIELYDSNVIEGGVLDWEDAAITSNTIGNCIIPQT